MGFCFSRWTFAGVAWTPSINYRSSSFDEDFDPLFIGFSRSTYAHVLFIVPF